MAFKILVVDDEPDIRDLMQRRFRREIRHGELVFDFAANGIEALEKIRENGQVDLVISDINMPGMDGLTLLRHLQQFEDSLKAIIMSAYGDMENIRAAMNRGAFDFVTKPIDFQDLQITVKKTLDQLDVLKEAFEARAAAERARTNLARYVSPRLVHALSERDEPFGPPREQEIGVLFADLRGFTAMSERMSPAEVLLFLRDFHTRMETLVFDRGGTLNDYIGDGVFATFGVPDTTPGDAGNALACAFDMLRTVEAWNGERVAAGAPPVRVGVGVHYGPAVLGDIGSERSMDFTVIGDTVNVASRLERLTRELDRDLVVSGALIDRARLEAGPAVALLDGLSGAGAFAIRGRDEKVEVFTASRAPADTAPAVDDVSS